MIDVKQLQILDNTEKKRFEAHLEGDDYAFITYSLRNTIIEMTHTEVPPAYQGMGIASKLVHDALESAKARNLKVIPSCPTVAAYIAKHPEYEAIRLKRFDE
ncbi:MAG: GNAT family N-acetyltransferase [Chloroflexota bacterium]